MRNTSEKYLTMALVSSRESTKAMEGRYDRLLKASRKARTCQRAVVAAAKHAGWSGRLDDFDGMIRAIQEAARASTKGGSDV